MELVTLSATAFKSPAIALSGVVDYEMYMKFRKQFDEAAEKEIVVIELSTLGGDPEVARMMGEDVRFASEMEPQRRFVFLGKAAIYSAGTTFMSFFARQNRYFARGTRLMIHERKLSKTLMIDGPLTTCIAVVKATLNEIECSIAIQNEGFENLIRGSKLTLEEVLQKAPANWYLEAQEALSLGLVEAVCDKPIRHEQSSTPLSRYSPDRRRILSDVQHGKGDGIQHDRGRHSPACANRFCRRRRRQGRAQTHLPACAVIDWVA